MKATQQQSQSDKWEHWEEKESSWREFTSRRNSTNWSWYEIKRDPGWYLISIEQENAELKRINTKLAKEITEPKAEIQKYKFNEEKFKDDDQRVSYYTGLACFNTLMTLLNLVKLLSKKGNY